MNKVLEKIYECGPIPLQNFLIGSYGRKIRRQRFIEQYREMTDFLEKSQWFTPDELREYQNERLRIVIEAAYANVPYYRRVMDERGLKPSDIRTAADLPKLPHLTKEIVRKNFVELRSRAISHDELVEGHTSGTTGSPFAVLWDQSVSIAHNVFLWRGRRWAGFDFGDRYASLLGRTIVPLRQRRPPFWRINKPWNQFLFSSFHLRREWLPYYVEALRKFDVKAIEAYPSTIYILARYLEETGGELPLNCIVTSSETLLPIQRELIERRFQCKVFDAYSQAERVMFSAECDQHAGHHLHSEFGITEIVDENCSPVPEGGCGIVLATGFWNMGMPLIRFRLGDVSGYETSTCPCGRGLPLLLPVTTKAEDIVITPDGRFITASGLTHPFKPLHGVESSQIIQERLDHLVIKIVKRSDYSDHESELLLEAMQRRLGPEMNIAIDFVDEIPRTANGKYRWVISKVPLKFGNIQTQNLYTHISEK